MTVTLSLFAGVGAQFLDNNGNILSGGKIYTYVAGTTTPLATYTSNLGTVTQSNPIILDSTGRIPSGELWLTNGYGYKFIVQDANSVLIGTYDNVPSSAQPPMLNDASSIAYEQGYTVTAGSFIVGKTYLITSVGSTNFQAIGAISNTVGVYFTATGAGSGTGTAQLSVTVQAKLQQTIAITDFGVIGDGSNEYLKVQAALNYLASGKIKTLDFCGLTITINQTVYVPSGAKLKGNNATIKCSTTSFTNDGNLSGITALIANKNANLTDGSATDYDIEISGFNFIAGSNVAMDGIYLANTVNAYIHDNSFTYQQAAQYAHLVDCHHTNTNTLIEHNRFYHVSTTIVNGACIAFRNSSSLIPSDGLIARSNYMYKNGTANTDEFMWVNGSTGVTSNCKILNNNFVSGSTDVTRSVLTVYPYTNSGSITTSEVISTLIDGNTFTHGNTVSYVILVGYSGESRPAQGVIISNNIFNISSITAIKLITASKGLLIYGNICTVLSGQRAVTFFSADSSYFGTETAKCYNNTLVGLYNIAFLGGYVTNNYCQECNYFAYNTRSVINNIVDTIHYNGAYIEASVSYVDIEDNQFTMNTVNSSIGSLPYAIYTQALNTVIQDNIIIFVTNGFYTLRTANSSTYAASVYFSRNKLFKNGATDTPAFQSFSYPLGASDNNWLFDRNSSTTPAAGYNVSGFTPATGHVNMYDDIGTGGSVTIGTVNSTTGVRSIVTTVT